MVDTEVPVADPDVVFVRLQGQTETAAAAASQQVEVVAQLVKHTAALSRDARGAGAERKVLQQRLGALQTEVEHLKDDLDATVGHIHAAAQQSLQFLSFNKALQGAVDELTSTLQDEKRARLLLEQQLKQLQDQVMEQGSSLHQLQQHSKQQNTLLVTLQEDQMQQAKTLSEHSAQKVSSARQQQQVLALTRQLDADLRDTQKVLAQELLGLRQQVKTTLRAQARSQALYSFSKKRTEGLQDALTAQQRDLARLQAKVSTAMSAALRAPAAVLARARPAPEPKTPAAAAAPEEPLSLESSLEELLTFDDTTPTDALEDTADAAAAVAALPSSMGGGAKPTPAAKSAAGKLSSSKAGRTAGTKKSVLSAGAKAGGAAAGGGGIIVPRSARASSADKRVGVKSASAAASSKERLAAAAAAIAAATQEDFLAGLEVAGLNTSDGGALPAWSS